MHMHIPLMPAPTHKHIGEVFVIVLISSFLVVQLPLGFDCRSARVKDLLHRGAQIELLPKPMHQAQAHNQAQAHV